MEKSSLAVIFSIVVIGAVVLLVGRGITSESNRARQLEAQAVIAQAQAAEAQARVQLKALEPLALAAKIDTLLTIGYAISDRAAIGALLLVIAAERIIALFRQPAPVAPAPAPREEFEDGDTL